MVIHPDDRVVIRIARSEMGQGTYTALAQLVAEELDCDWMKVSAEFASPNEHVRRNRIWGSMSTGGSQGVRSSQDYVRKAGAAAREMLVAAAAAQWKVPAAECTVDKGVITHGPTKRRLRYGQVATAAAKLPPPKDVELRDPKDWKIAGKPLRRLDIPDKVLGKPVFATDVTLPGNAARLHRPVPRVRRQGEDASTPPRREKMRGVKKVVREEDFVAVVADSWWRANQALKQVKVEWDVGKYGERLGRDHHGDAARGPGRSEAAGGEEGGRRGRGDGHGGEGDRGRVRLALPQPRHDGAAGVHRVDQARRVRGGVDFHAERRGLARRRRPRPPASRRRRSRSTR